MSWLFPKEPEECEYEHRGPQGPNEDISVCNQCGMPTFSRRPVGESFGWHIADCSLPMRHLGYCVGGGEGHVKPKGERFRG